MLTLTLTPLDAETFGGDLDPDDGDPILDFAAEHIGDGESITFEVAYEGSEAAPDTITVNRAGEVTSVA